MPHSTITALMPIKSASERLPGKNFLNFFGKPLFVHMLEKLSALDPISEIVVNTDAEDVISLCKSNYPKVQIIHRPECLRGHAITMNALIAHDLQHITGEHFLQTHCTNPLLSVATIQLAIEQYFQGLHRFDSLFSVNAIQKRAYDAHCKPINHRNELLLPTQDLEPVLIENSNLFLFSRQSFIANQNSRIGKNPQAFPMREIEAIDIDFEADLLLAKTIYQNRQLLQLE